MAQFFSRPGQAEGVVWLALAFFRSLKDKGRSALTLWLFPFSLIGVFYLALWLYFGTITPHGAIGRSTMFHSYIVPGDHSAYFILSMLGQDTWQNLLPSTCLEIVGYYGCFAMQGLLAVLLFAQLSRSSRWLAFYFAAIAWLLGFFALTDPWTFSWYYAWFALVPVFAIPLLVESILIFVKQSHYLFARAFALFLVVCLIDLALAVHPYADKMMPIPWGISQVLATQVSLLRCQVLGWDAEAERLMLYKRAVDYLQATNVSCHEIASWEPGMLGFEAPHTHILDLGGLLSEAPLKYYPVPPKDRTGERIWGSIPIKAVLELKPECLIILDAYADNGLLKDPDFLGQYQLLKFWPLQVWGGNGLYLFHRIAH